MPVPGKPLSRESLYLGKASISLPCPLPGRRNDPRDIFLYPLPASKEDESDRTRSYKDQRG